MPALRVSPPAARRFVRRVLGFDAPFDTIGEALVHHGYVQIDPLNVCGRMHDLILRNRVREYREGGLHDYLYGGRGTSGGAARGGFEHYLPEHGVLVAFPLAAWPFLQAQIEERPRLRHRHWGRFSPTEARLAERVLAEIGARGPLMSDEISHEGSKITAWGTRGRAVKAVLEKLFAHGRVLISERRNFRRVYDLAERVLPPEVRNAPPASAAEAQRWLVLTRLRQRRLVTLRRDELPLVADAVDAVEIEGCPLLFCLREDAPHLLAAAEGQATDPTPRLLAPLDPLVYDRRLTKRLWDFDYTWEVYTPSHKRIRGYYALPVLAGLEIVGHVDPKADRKQRKLVVVSRRIRRGYSVAAATADLARFLGLRR
jgi:uncharacterized protein YcaQ